MQISGDEKLGDIIIYDASGKKLIQKFISAFETSIDISELGSGIYFLRADPFTMLKFIKQ